MDVNVHDRSHGPRKVDEPRDEVEEQAWQTLHTGLTFRRPENF
jgi:hypothetical protein